MQSAKKISNMCLSSGKNLWREIHKKNYFKEFFLQTILPTFLMQYMYLVPNLGNKMHWCESISFCSSWNVFLGKWHTTSYIIPTQEICILKYIYLFYFHVFFCFFAFINNCIKLLMLPNNSRNVLSRLTRFDIIGSLHSDELYT